MARRGTRIEDYAFLSDTQTGALWVMTAVSIGFVFRGLIRTRVLRRFSVIVETDIGGSLLRRLRKRVAAIMGTRLSLKQKLKQRAARCALSISGSRASGQIGKC